MIPHRSRYLSVFIFLLLVIPLITGLAMPESAQEILKEARARAPAPSFPSSMGQVAAWPKEAEAYLADHFGLRSQMVRLYANLARRWLGEGNGSILVGRHGHLFYLGEVGVQQSAGLVRRDSEVTETADFLATMRDALDRRSIRFVVASPPNAATIYQDDLPRWARRNGRPTEYDALFGALAARGIKMIDLRQAVWLSRSKGPAYFLYDTHWTARGAIAGFNAIAEADGHPDWRVEADGALTPSTSSSGDLARMIGVSADVSEPVEALALPPAIFPPGSRVDLTGGPFPPYVTTSDRPGETIMIIGDSFTIYYLAALLMKDVGRVIWQHHKRCGFDWTLIDRFQPDEVWWMPTERLLLCSPNVRPEGFPSAQRFVPEGLPLGQPLEPSWTVAASLRSAAGAGGGCCHQATFGKIQEPRRPCRACSLQANTSRPLVSTEPKADVLGAASLSGACRPPGVCLGITAAGSRALAAPPTCHPAPSRCPVGQPRGDRPQGQALGPRR
jgi:alginate O-acetyltransferase complex protein AlgJ